MRKLVDIIRLIFISVEFLYVILLFALVYFIPSWFSLLGTQFHNNTDIWKYIPVIPVALAGFAVTYSWKILHPLENSSNRILYEWEYYWMLKYRVVASIIICAVCVVCSISIWLFSSKLTSKFLGVLFLASSGVSAIVIFNQLLAAFKIKEILEP